MLCASVTPENVIAARRLLGSVSDDRDAKAIAAHARAVCQELARHLSRLVGELGVHTLFSRSLALAAPAFPCLKTAGPTAAETPYEALCRCLEGEPPDVALASAVHVLQTFIELLERFIGTGLVESLLHEVWPASFPGVKETT